MKTEQQLVQAAKQGDQHSYAQLILSHQDLVYHLVLQLAPAEAEDLVQEIFIKAYYNLPGFRGDSSFKTWLVRLAINHCKNYQRRQQLEQAISRKLAREAKETWTQKIGNWPDRSEALDIQAGLQQLSTKHRQVIVLHDVLGFRYGEIAEILNLPPGTIKSRLYYARRELRRHLTQQPSEGV